MKLETSFLELVLKMLLQKRFLLPWLLSPGCRPSQWRLLPSLLGPEDVELVDLVNVDNNLLPMVLRRYFSIIGIIVGRHAHTTPVQHSIIDQ